MRGLLVAVDRVLVRFYGEHSSMWVKLGAVEAIRQGIAEEGTRANTYHDTLNADEERIRALRSWGRQHNK